MNTDVFFLYTFPFLLSFQRSPVRLGLSAGARVGCGGGRASHGRPTGVSPSSPAGGRSEHGRSFPAAGLIHGSFFPQKTPQGHVRKESPGCGFSGLGSRLFHLISIRGSFGSRIFEPNSGAGAPSGAALGSPDPGGLGSAPPRRTPPRRP